MDHPDRSSTTLGRFVENTLEVIGCILAAAFGLMLILLTWQLVGRPIFLATLGS